MLAVLAFCALVIPWLNPYSSGPSTSVGPWLVSAFCALVAWILYRLGEGRIVDQGHWPRCIAASWMGAALISSAFALCQYFGVGTIMAPLVSPAAVGEAYANLRQRNQFASLTAVGMAALLWWAPHMRQRLAVPAILLLAIGNAAAGSRTGLLQIVMLTFFAGLWSGPDRRRRLQLCVVGLLGYVIAAPMLPALLEAITGVTAHTMWRRITHDESCSSRLVLWSNVLHLVSLKPWAGWGWGELDYAHYFTLYPGERFCDILDNAHNLPLHLAVELGVPVAVALCGSFLWWAWRANPWRETDRTRQLAWSVLAIILLHSMFEYPLWYGPFQLAAGLSLGLLWGSRCDVSAEAAPRWWWSPHLGAATAVIAMGAVAFAAWDYRRISQIYMPPEARDADYREDTIARIRGSRLFASQVIFAELTTTPLTRENAQWIFDNARALLHFSPEPRVIEKVIESAALLGLEEEARAHLARFRAAFPQDYAHWKEQRLKG